MIDCLRLIIAFVALAGDVEKKVALQAKSVAYMQAPFTQLKNASFSSYFQHESFGLNTYNFGFEVNDTENMQFRNEQRYVNGSVVGSYGYLRPDGRITITHFQADGEHGYLSQTQTYEAAAEAKRWQEHWPTHRPNILASTPQRPAMNASYEAHQHLNLIAGLTEDDGLMNAMAQQDFDLNSVDELAAQVLAPPLLDIVNGRVPLQREPVSSTLGFETVQNFLPANFAITPFQPPQKADGDRADVQRRNKYEKAKANNAEKTMAREQMINTRTLAPLPDKREISPM